MDIPPGLYAVVEHGDDGARPIGQVGIGPDGILRIIAGIDSEALVLAVAETNQRAAMHQDVPAPAGARRFQQFTRIVPRGTLDFVAEMLKHLRNLYGLELVRLDPPPP